MWSEERIRTVLETKEDALANAKAQLREAEAWVEAGFRMQAADFVSASYKDMLKKELLVTKLEEQVKVLNAVLDIKK